MNYAETFVELAERAAWERITELGLKKGDRVEVTDTAGREHAAQLVDILENGTCIVRISRAKGPYKAGWTLAIYPQYIRRAGALWPVIGGEVVLLVTYRLQRRTVRRTYVVQAQHVLDEMAKYLRASNAVRVGGAPGWPLAWRGAK